MARAFAVLITVIVGMLAATPAAMACGGGGSGGYRKPVRPDHFNQKANGHNSQAPAAATPATNPAGQ